MSTSTPNLASKVLDFNKAVVTNSLEQARSVASVVADGVSAATAAARDAGATVVGQTRSAVSRTTATARTGAKEVAGQTRAQGKRAAERVDQAANRTVDRATNVVENAPAPGTPYESWTKEQLYERAQSLDIDGRSTMNKQQLIKALRG